VLADLGEKQGIAPPIGHQMVQGQRDDPLVVWQQDEHCAQQRSSCQIKRATVAADDQFFGAHLRLLYRTGAQVTHVHKLRELLLDDCAQAHSCCEKTSAQRVVALNDQVQSLSEQVHMQVASQPEGRGFVICRSILAGHSIGQPQALLGKGERGAVLTAGRCRPG
jgi:hypothetical protein